MPTNETNTGMSWIWVLFIVLILYVIFCNGGGLFGGCNNNNNCNRVSNCEVEKQEIIDSARTQYMIEQQGTNTRAATQAGFEAVMAQNSRIYEQGLQESLFDAKMEIQQLKGQIFTKEQTDGIAKALAECCCGFNRRMDAIECMMVKQPPFYPAGNTFQGFGYQCGNPCNNI